MPIYRWKDDYFYGGKRDEIVKLITDIEAKGEKYGMIRNETDKFTPKDPEGNPIIYYTKKVSADEIEDWETPGRYPGKYYWIWHNGEFFEVIAETKKYVYVKVQGIAHAAALGIPIEKVYSTYPEDAEVEEWWLKKSEIKMPDEIGKGKYIYLKSGAYFLLDVYEIVERDGKQIRVRGKKCPFGRPEYEYEGIKKYIRMKIFPWDISSRVIKEIAENAEPEAWIEGDCVYYEATFDLETLKKYKGKRDEYGRVMLDYY
ncbi:MAG: hypothetical protein GXO25_06940, partial [Euryarchaeota archaeon]|nr:hypothetical protein [Euryarchaeota archaeon]